MFLMIGILWILISHVQTVVVQLQNGHPPATQDSGWLYHSDTASVIAALHVEFILPLTGF